MGRRIDFVQEAEDEVSHHGAIFFTLDREHAALTGQLIEVFSRCNIIKRNIALTDPSDETRLRTLQEDLKEGERLQELIKASRKEVAKNMRTAVRALDAAQTVLGKRKQPDN